MDGPSRTSRKVWTHRAAAIICTALVPPALLWWRDSVLFVILISLATQIYAALSAAEAADDKSIIERLDRIERHLRESR